MFLFRPLFDKSISFFVSVSNFVMKINLLSEFGKALFSDFLIRLSTTLVFHVVQLDLLVHLISLLNGLQIIFCVEPFRIVVVIPLGGVFISVEVLSISDSKRMNRHIDVNISHGGFLVQITLIIFKGI